MAPSIDKLLPAIAALSHGDKFQLVQLVLKQLAEEDGVECNAHPSPSFDPRLFFGIAQQPKEMIDDYLASTREGWL